VFNANETCDNNGLRSRRGGIDGVGWTLVFTAEEICDNSESRLTLDRVEAVGATLKVEVEDVRVAPRSDPTSSKDGRVVATDIVGEDWLGDDASPPTSDSNGARSTRGGMLDIFGNPRVESGFDATDGKEELFGSNDKVNGRVIGGAELSRSPPRNEITEPKSIKGRALDTI
jgi:hypothetical protein